MRDAAHALTVWRYTAWLASADDYAAPIFAAGSSRQLASLLRQQQRPFYLPAHAITAPALKVCCREVSLSFF